MAAYEKIQVVANGLVYEGWESVTIVSTMYDPYVEAIVQTTEKGGVKDQLNPVFTEWNFPPGTPVQILASGDPVLYGIVDIYEPQVDAESHQITLNIKSPAKILPVTSVNHPTGFFENMTDIAIAAEILAPIGMPVGLNVMAQATMIPYYQVRRGGSNYQEIMRLFQQGGKMLWSKASDGAMTVTDGNVLSGVVLDGMIVQGINVLKMSARLSDQQTTVVEVQGQAASGTDPAIHLEPFGIALNPVGPDNQFGLLYKLVIDQAVTTRERAQIRANYEANRALGDRLQAQFTVPGWRTSGAHGSGPIWEINWDVHCTAPWLKIDCTLRIVKVILNQDNQGATTSTIFVTDAASLGGQKSECSEGHELADFFHFSASAR